MAKKKLHNLMPDSGDLPSGVPSVDEAWADMRNKLLEQMPDKTAPSVIPKKNKRWGKYSLLLVLLALPIAWLLNSTLQNSTNDTNESAAVEIKNSDKANAISKPSTDINPSSATGTVADSQAANEAPNTNSEKEHEDLSRTHDEKNEVTAGQKKSTRTTAPDEDPSLNPKRIVLDKNTKAAGLQKAKDKNHHAGKNKKQNNSDGDFAIDNDLELSPEPSNEPNIILIGSLGHIDTAIGSAFNLKVSSIETAVPKSPEGWEFKVGLHWTVQVPMYSTSDYFTGPNANTQFYQLMLPGIWFRMKVEKSALTAEVNPFYTNLVPAKSFGTFTSVENITDTVIIKTEEKSLRKTFGVSATLSYDYNVGERWWLGGGLQAYFLNKAIARVDVEEERRAINGSGKTIVSYSNTYTLPEEEWAYFTKSSIGVTGQLLYEAPRWQAGLRLIFPVIPLAKQEGPTNPLRSEFIFRVPVFKKNK